MDREELIVLCSAKMLCISGRESCAICRDYPSDLDIAKLGVLSLTAEPSACEQRLK